MKRDWIRFIRDVLAWTAPAAATVTVWSQANALVPEIGRAHV